jgi:dTDP-4-amino-4,6-dideoxygalactose transaminase
VHGAKQKYFHELIGGNFRLHELQAAFLRVKLKHLDSSLKKRRESAQMLMRSLQEKWSAIMPLDSCICQGQGSAAEQKPGTILLPFSCHSGQEEHTWNQFVIRVKGAGQRDIFSDQLVTKGIQTEVYYPRALHEQECFKESEVAFPAAQLFCDETLALPVRDFAF